jgi:hypothetical protein
LWLSFNLSFLIDPSGRVSKSLDWREILARAYGSVNDMPGAIAQDEVFCPFSVWYSAPETALAFLGGELGFPS